MTKRLLSLLILVISLAIFQSAFAAGLFELPADAQKLLPADPAAVVGIASVNELLDQYMDVQTAFEEEGKGSREQLLEAFEQQLPRFAEFVDFDRPLVLAAGLPDLMTGGDPPLTYILPLKADFQDRDNMLAEAGFASHAIAGNYLAISTVPEYVPAATPPALSGHLAAGVIAMTLDLEMVVLNFGPFLEMGLAGIPTRTDENPEGFSAEEAAALATTLR